MLSCDGVGPADEVLSVRGCQTVESRMLHWTVGSSGAGIGIGGGDSNRRVSAT